MLIVILARGHGSGKVERQWSNSDVSSGATTGSSLSFGLYWVVSFVALPLLRCACTFAASYTACSWGPCWLTIALRYLHACLLLRGSGVLGPVSCGLFVSACSGCPFVSGVFWSVCFLCGVFVVSRVPVGLWLLLLSFPRLFCSSLLLVCGVASAWLALSLLRSPPALPAPSVSPLVPSGPVSALLVPPSGYLVVFVAARLSCLWHGVL